MTNLCIECRGKEPDAFCPICRDDYKDDKVHQLYFMLTESQKKDYKIWKKEYTVAIGGFDDGAY